MKTSSVSLGGKTYLVCFSTRVVLACEDRAGSVGKELEAVEKEGNEGKIRELIWLLYEILKAGSKLAELESIENPALPSYDDFIDLVGLSDFTEIRKDVSTAIINDVKRTVEVEPEKKTDVEQRTAEE